MMKAMTTVPSHPTPVSSDEYEQIDVPSRLIYTIALIALCFYANVTLVAFSVNYFETIGNAFWFNFKALAMLVAFASPVLLISRAKRPYVVSLVISSLVMVFQLSPLFAAVGVAGVVARRGDKQKVAGCVAFGFVAGVVTVASDLLLPPDASLLIHGYTLEIMAQALHPAEESMTVLGWFLCLLIPAIEIGLAIIFGTVMRNSAVSKRSLAQAKSEKQRADTIQTSLSNKQIADSIAAEAHDTLAHSLSLIAVNATTLGADVAKLQQSQDSRQLHLDIQRRADDLRDQAAGALDEAHSIIDMLRHPDEAARLLAPGEETALTQEALDALFSNVRDSGTELRLWVDIRGLSALNPNVGKVAFRAIQEGLTNARRHAPGAPVSLSVSVIPTTGIAISMMNPVIAGEAAPTSGGNGLPGLSKRVQETKGTCTYGVDNRSVFHLDVRLPFVPLS